MHGQLPLNAAQSAFSCILTMANRSMWEDIFAAVTSGSSIFLLSCGMYGAVGGDLSLLASWKQSGKAITKMTIMPNMMTTGDGSADASCVPCAAARNGASLVQSVAFLDCEI